jgi:hypothetical protein
MAAQRADKGRSSTATPVEQRRLKSDFAKVPEAVRQAIVTQAIRENATLAQAVVADAGASSALRRAREPEVTPVTPPRDPWGQVENAMQSIDYRMRELARHAADVRWTDHRYDVLGEWIAEQRTALTALRANPEAPALRSVGSAS